MSTTIHVRLIIGPPGHVSTKRLTGLPSITVLLMTSRPWERLGRCSGATVARILYASLQTAAPSGGTSATLMKRTTALTILLGAALSIAAFRHSTPTLPPTCSPDNAGLKLA